MRSYAVLHAQHKKELAFAVSDKKRVMPFCVPDSELSDVLRAGYAIANHSAKRTETSNKREIFVVAYIDYGFHTKPDFILATRQIPHEQVKQTRAPQP
jgi:hypothetical protein